MSVEAITEYLREVRGLSPVGLFEWLAIADAEALAWMNEESAKERERIKRSPPAGVAGQRRR